MDFVVEWAFKNKGSEKNCASQKTHLAPSPIVPPQSFNQSSAPSETRVATRMVPA